ncbi:MAG: site-specific DNA-methyltransferase [Gammaproteobacteria bacterium]|nr:site-specific DNA-methyltransferase [Gammaproteobacteria bacterium]
MTIKEDQPELYTYLNGIRGVGNPYNFAYLAYMAIRLIECQRVLKKAGSIYLHCDPTMSHYLKSLMDCIFGERNFRNEIVWCYRGGGKGSRDFARKHDVLLRYCQSRNFVFNEGLIRVPYEGTGKNRKDASMGGSRRKGGGNSSYRPNPLGKIPEDWWVIPQLNSNDPERVGYPTQKPLRLLERIIRASSSEGDMVLDPFCGCATTCVSSEMLDRKWIGIDVSFKAYELVKRRLETRRS